MEKTIKNYLESRKESSNILECEVIDIILQHEYEGLENFMSNVLNHGCVSGIVSELIYYYQTEKFFDTFKDEINDLAHSLSEELYGNSFELYHNLNYECSKNSLSWFAFEEITRILANELELNY
jgi:hypothetical protein